VTRPLAAPPVGAAPSTPAHPMLAHAPDDSPRPPAPRGAGSAPTGTGWAAELELGFARAGERTVLARRRHNGPLQVQRPFYPEGPGVCHVYVLHPPGGVVGGDRLALDVAVEADAHALVTTPAAGKLYRSGGPWAELTNTLRVADGGVLEWLPQETIAFAGALARQTTRVHLATRACFVGWEVLCLGRPAAGEAFAHGEVRQTLELWREGRPLLHERARCSGGAELLQAPWGLAGRPVTATLWAVAPEGGLAEPLRAAAIPPPPGGLAGVTEINGVLIARCLVAHADGARSWLMRAWQALRPALAGRVACPPRIWRT